VMAPAMCVLLTAGALMAYYNWRSTGNMLLMPYQVNESQYHITKLFLWQHRNPVPQYHHLSMRIVYCYWELPIYLRSRTFGGLADVTFSKLTTYYMFFLWPLFVAALPACWVMLKSPRVRLLAVSTLVLLGGLLLLSWPAQGHYAAPATAMVTGLMLYALRLMRTWKPLGRAFGRQLALTVVLLLFGWMAFRTAHLMLNPYYLDFHTASSLPLRLQRARIRHHLEGRPGRHLVIVHERIPPNRGEDWVYNRADIDHSKVIWARDMGPDKNQELLRYYPDRQIWFVDLNDESYHLISDNRRSGDFLVASRSAVSNFAPLDPAEHHVPGTVATQKSQKADLPVNGS